MKLINIGASLSKAHFISGKKTLRFFYFAIATTLLLPLLTIVILIVWNVAQLEWDYYMTFVLIFGNIMSLLLFSVCLFIVLKHNQTKKIISLWLNDTVELDAYSHRIDESGILLKATKIQVNFMYKGRVYTRESTAKVFGGQKGCTCTFNKYANKKVRILYSPKYDEVLILKQNNNTEKTTQKENSNNDNNP